jgi:hypothetical protein
MIFDKNYVLSENGKYSVYRHNFEAQRQSDIFINCLANEGNRVCLFSLDSKRKLTGVFDGQRCKFKFQALTKNDKAFIKSIKVAA